MSSPIDMCAIQKPTIISIIMIKTILFHDNGNAIPAKCPKVNLTPCERIVVQRGILDVLEEMSREVFLT